MAKLNEAETRKRRIDPMLVAAGWNIVFYDKKKGQNSYTNCAIREYPTDYGPADYALCVGGKILGIIEAKKEESGTQSVLKQAERYSRGLSESPLNYNGFKVPFLYSTNGKDIRYHDIRQAFSRSRPIVGVYTPDSVV